MRSIEDFAKAASDQLCGEAESAEDVPHWVHEATARIGRTYMHGPMTALSDLELTPYRIGYVLGMLQFSSESMTRALDAVPTSSTRFWRRLSPAGRRKITEEWQICLSRCGYIDAPWK